MSIFLTILKILLIVLAVVVGIVFLLLLLVLFTPVSYGRQFKYDSSVSFDLDVNWLCRFLSIKAKKQGEESEDEFKLFWFYNVPKGEGFLAILKKIWAWLYPRALYFLTSVMEDEKLRNDPSLMNSAKLLGECIVGILKAVLPNNLHGDVVYGLPSPDKTGYLTGFLATILPPTSHLDVTPDFTEACFSCDVEFSAKVFIYQVLHNVMKILCSKDIKKLLDLLSEKYQSEVTNGQ